MTHDDTFIERLRDIFVDQDIFNLRISPIEKIVYGAVGLMLIAIVGAIIALVLQKP